MDGFGTITWWGFSPAIDFLDEDLNLALSKMKLHTVQNEDEVNILMIGAGDCRHMLKTIARSHRHRRTKLNFYILENNLELYARHMMFLALALEPQTRMGLQEKTELFLELFGNSYLREQSMQYVEKMSDYFIKMVTDADYLEKKLPIFDLSLLKFKERDFLEGIFKFWRNKDRSVFDIEKCWDLRLRKYLGVRYDAIPNLFDWDYSMKLVDKGASIIHNAHYKEWRYRGMAFQIREGTYDVPNKTLASGMTFNTDGERVTRRGYWGDIIVSPYVALGIECEEQAFFKKSNQQHTSTAVDVAEYNVMSMFHELAHRSKYQLPDVSSKPAEKKTAELTEITEEDEKEETKNEEKPTEEKPSNPLDLEYEPTDLDYVRIHFLPLNSAPDLHKKSRYQKLFNFVYISNSMVHLLTPDLAQTFADVANVVLETSKFMLELKPEQHQEFVKKITSMAEGVGCKATETPDEENSRVEFTFQRTETAS